MHRHLREEAHAPEVPIDQRTGIAEEIDFDDGLFDAVVTTLVLCSVSDLSVSLQEILRVLRPGGNSLF